MVESLATGQPGTAGCNRPKQLTESAQSARETHASARKGTAATNWLPGSGFVDWGAGLQTYLPEDRSCLRLRAQLQAEIGELRGIHRRRGVGERVEAAGDLREGDHVPDVVGALEQHHGAVEAGRDAAVRRCAVAQRPQQEAEALLGVLLR